MEYQCKEMPVKIKARIEKLKALVDRGVGGERENAERLLRELCATYGFRPEELLDEETYTYEFRFKDSLRKLFLQTFSSLFGTKQEYMTIRCYKGFLRVDLTRAQWIQLTEVWEWHKKNFAAERRRIRKLFERAYFEGYNLYPCDTCPEFEEKNG